MAGTLRDQLESAVNEVEEETAQQAPESVTTGDATTVVSAGTPAAGATPVVAAVETAEQKAGRTAGRARDNAGRLLPGKAEKPAPAAAVAAPAAVIPPVEAALTALQRPSSWKKEMWPIWDKLTAGAALDAKEARQLAEYTGKRESDFASGVSTYKTEYEKAKPLVDAITPYRQILEQHKVDPAAHVGELLRSHHTLVMGTPQEKLALVARIIQQNKVPIEQLFVKGQDGQIYFNQDVMRAPQAQSQPQQQPDLRKTVQEILSEERLVGEVNTMKADKTNYLHFDQVVGTMVGLLQSGLSPDYASAYKAAIRLPQHSDIFDAMQEQQRAADEAKKREESLKAVTRARANAISPRSAPSTGNGAGTGAKGLRGTLESVADEVLQSRV